MRVFFQFLGRAIQNRPIVTLIGFALTGGGTYRDWLASLPWPLNSPTVELLLILAGVLVLAFVVWQQAQTEIESFRKPRPDFTLKQLVERETEGGGWNAPGTPQKTSDTLVRFRELASLQQLSVWGRKDASGGNLNFYPLETVPSSHWSDAHLSYLDYLNDERCSTGRAKHPGPSAFYADLHFSAAELNQVWPKQKKSKWRFRWPMTREH